MVENTFRRGGIGLKMFQASYKQLLLDEIKFDFIDAEAFLIPFFTKLGYKTIGTIDYPMYESSTLMMLDVLEIKHLEKVKSPFQSLYRNSSHFHFSDQSRST